MEANCTWSAPRRFARAFLRLTAPLGVLAFWCGMAAAAHVYPAGYDWRFQTISVLLYSDHNPHGYLSAWAGLELCALCGLVWTSHLKRRLEGAGSGSPVLGRRWLRAGFVCMCLAVLPDRVLRVSKMHELMAIGAFVGICIGVMQELYLTRDIRKTHGARGTVARLGTFAQAGAPLVPVLFAGMTQAYLALARPTLPWVSPAWRARGISPYLSFAVWEWVSCVVFSACILVLCRRRMDDW